MQDDEAVNAPISPELTVAVLARGIVLQHRYLEDGRIAVRQEEAVIDPDMKAGCRLASGLRIVEGGSGFGSIHIILDLARRPLCEWGIEAFAAMDFPHRDLILIDPVLRIPTVEAHLLAQGSSGFADLREKFAYERFRRAVDSDPEPERAYSELRLWMASHAVTPALGFLHFVEERFRGRHQHLFNDFYAPPKRAWLQDGRIYVCARCSAPLAADEDRDTHPDGVCVSPICRRKGPTTAARAFTADDNAKILHTEPLEYWVGPAIDERAVLDAAEAGRFVAEAYPRMDACDVALHLADGDEVGIDVKNHVSAVALVKSLNEGRSRHRQFGRRIIAVGEEVIDRYGNYVTFLRTELSPDLGLEVISVPTLLKKLRAGRV